MIDGQLRGRVLRTDGKRGPEEQIEPRRKEGRQGGKEVRVSARGDFPIARDQDGALNYLFFIDPPCSGSCCHSEEGDYQWGIITG